MWVSDSIIMGHQNISDDWRLNLREYWLIGLGVSGCDCLLMEAPSLFDGFPFDAFPPLENGRSSSEVNVDRRQVVQALVIALIVVVLDELADAQLELAR